MKGITEKRLKEEGRNDESGNKKRTRRTEERKK
jgi:hypothetical protein